jgi:hypothetical protein
MLTFDLDTSDFDAAIERVVREIDAAPDRILDIAGEAAAHLRETDWYQDRTGDLRESTKAEKTDDGVVLTMGMPYASHVERAGFSDFEDLAEQSKEHVVTGLEKALTRAVR